MRNITRLLLLTSLLTVFACGKASIESAKQLLNNTTNESNSLKGNVSPNFGTGGIVLQDIVEFSTSGNEVGNQVLIDETGSIFVAGKGGPVPSAALWKFDSNGALDTTFGGGDGLFTHRINSNDRVNDMAFDSSGNIILVGKTFISGQADDLAVWRITPSGVLDTTFGGGNGYDEGNAVAIDSNDNIIVVGRSNGSTGTKAAIWKYTSNGVLDTSFGGGDGFITTTSNGVKTGVVIDSADNIYVTGYAGGEVTLWKYNTTGTLDSSFDSDGIFVFTNPGSDYSYDLVLDQTGNILLTGDLSDGSNSDMFIMRVTPLGNLDTTFGAGLGYITHNNAAGGNGYDSGKAINLDSEGNILIAGSSYDSSYDLAIWKVSPQGQLDTSFGGGNGYVTLNNIAGGNSGDRGEDLALTASGTLVVTGFSVGTTTDEMFLLNLE